MRVFFAKCQLVPPPSLERAVFSLIAPLSSAGWTLLGNEEGIFWSLLSAAAAERSDRFRNYFFFAKCLAFSAPRPLLTLQELGSLEFFFPSLHACIDFFCHCLFYV